MTGITGRVATPRWGRDRGAGRADQRGSISVELIVLTPVFVLIVVVVVAVGRVGEARQQVVEAARAGAEAAAIAPDPVGARSVADENVALAIGAHGSPCPAPQVHTDTGHFVPGGYVTVTVVCQVALADLAIPGFPGSTPLRASSTAPIDPYRSVAG
jgi:Flp pilus assembly protein TadG